MRQETFSAQKKSDTERKRMQNEAAAKKTFLKFVLSGKSAFFKRNDINASASGVLYVSYSQIHSVALRGIAGAITGEHGYAGMSGDEKIPAFMRAYGDVAFAVCPGGTGIFKTQMHKGNNATRFFNRKGKTQTILNYTEQWLIDPTWTIYVDLQTEQARLLAEKVINGESCFALSLGSNQHFAEISSPEIIECDPFSGVGICSSLQESGTFSQIKSDKDPFDMDFAEAAKIQTFSRLKLPSGLNENGYYDYKNYIFCNSEISPSPLCGNYYADSAGTIFSACM